MRIAAERDATSWLVAHTSTSAISDFGSLIPTKGSFPVAGLPRRFLGFTCIGFFMIWVLHLLRFQNKRPAKVRTQRTKTGLTPTIGDQSHGQGYS
jgi:hypothetical protein